jgi:LuxR family maltose regulon positive regulatory protein
LALLAILHDAEGDEAVALAQLRRAVELAQPGGIVRLFVDLGPPVARLLQRLQGQDILPDYMSQFLGQILAVFDESASDQDQFSVGKSLRPSPALANSLTSREMEVIELLAKRLTNKEIARKLVISPDTVKTHTLNIYAKLNVHSRRQAVDRAIEIGFLSAN